MATITAVYENGMFRPTGPVDLPEGATGHVVPAPTRAEQDEARRRVFEILSHSYDTGDPEAAARHDEHQP
jgi:predicted DNA-binding antitoxin AbrB/MazE fold protein